MVPVRESVTYVTSKNPVLALFTIVVLLAPSSTLVFFEGSRVPSLPDVFRPGFHDLVPEGSSFVKRGIVIANGPPGSPDSVWARDPSVLIDTGGVYRMWYRGSDGFRWRILYATSTDGIVWNKQGTVLDSSGLIGAPFVSREDSTYHLWFQDQADGTIRQASSVDGRSWSPPAVALAPGTSGAWDRANALTPWVVKTSPGYLMYYTGSDGSSEAIGVAASTTYTGFSALFGGPIISIGPPGSWDDSAVRFPAVFPGSLWTMYYAGRNSSVWSIGIATSSDGLNWTKAPGNPILTPAPYPSWENLGINGGSPLSDSGGLRFYYSGGNQSTLQIGLAVVPAAFEGFSYLSYLWIILVLAIGLPIAVIVVIFLLLPLGRRSA